MRDIPKELKAADKALFRIGKDVEILKNLTWPLSAKRKFLKQYSKGREELPLVKYPAYDFSKQRAELKLIMQQCKSQHPFSSLVKRTAQSYIHGLEMVEAVGTTKFLRLSSKLYGVPKDPVSNEGVSTLRAANRFLKSVRRFDLASICPPEMACLRPESVVADIKDAAKRKFGDEAIKIITDPKLKSKASASAKRIRIREATAFTQHDVHQLIEHELFVHTLTLLNGRKQPLKTLGLNSPRVTCSQEGLAVFAEFITNAIDVTRLQRISARVEGIQMGLDGADFIDVFEFFLANGQTEDESFFSAARIFRGGNVKGKVVFTKDLVYLKGFIEVHRFFLSALQHKRFLHPQYFVAGRMECQDVEALAPYFIRGTLQAPAFEPDWIMDRSTLLAFLLSSSVMNNLGLSKIETPKRRYAALS